MFTWRSENVQDLAEKLDRLVGVVKRFAIAPGEATTDGPKSDTAADPISIAILEREELRLGFRLPHLLRRLYTEVGNGGFGPGHGLFSMLPLSQFDRAIPDYYLSLRDIRARRGSVWPEGIVPFNDWGDLILSCVDLSEATQVDPPVLRFEPNMPEAATAEYWHGEPYRGDGLIPESKSLSIWFEEWIAGKEMFERPYQQG
jgi:hypothetical protein